MKLSKMKKEDLELLSNKDITYQLLEENKKSINTADLYKKIIELLELPKSSFDAKIGDYYTSLSTDKRFILLEDGTWDLRSRHTSDKVVKISDNEDEDDDEEEENEDMKDDQQDTIEEDNYDDSDDSMYDDNDDDLKDLVIIDEDELELEE
jgi:DNA-directed RNA polymerase subunit delta